MDNNNSTNPAPVVPNTVPPVTDASPQTQYPVPSSGNSKKIIFLFVVGLIVIAILVGGVYLLFAGSLRTAPAEQTVATQVPKALPEENLEKDLDSIDIDTESVEGLTDVDNDLEQL